MNQSQLANEAEQLLRLRIDRIRHTVKNLPKNDPRHEEFNVRLLRI